jgi:hypothetical protein
MQEGQQVHQREQRRQHRREEEEENLFWGLYIGGLYSLSEHLEEIDPDCRVFTNVHGYIGAFPFTEEYFKRVYPFYISSRVSDMTLNAIYDTTFITFVKMFKLNHPDWFEYTQNECLQHFIDFIALNPDPAEYYESETRDGYSYHDRLNVTPRTLEKPHYSAYAIDYSENGEYTEYYVGSGYFRNVAGREIPWDRRVGIWGPNALQPYNMYSRISELEYRGRGSGYGGYVDGDDESPVVPIQFRLSDGTPFDVSIDTSGEGRHMRFIENESNEDLFLFEESFQNEKRRLYLEAKRLDELKTKEYQENLRKHNEKQEKLKNSKAKKNQQKIENKRNYKEKFNKQLERWANFNASAYVDHPATLEMAQKFSVPLEPFVYRNIPVPVALPFEHRTPYLKEEIDEMLDDILGMLDD